MLRRNKSRRQKHIQAHTTTREQETSALAKKDNTKKSRKQASKPFETRASGTKHAAKNNGAQKSRTAAMASVARSNTWAAWAMVGVTIVTGAVLFLQWRTLQETNRLAATDQRPYVASTDIRLSEKELPGYWMFDVLVTNSGGTPTRDMRYLAMKSQTPPGDPAIAFANPPDEISQIDRGLVAPNGTIRLRLGGLGLPTTVLEKMADERGILFLSGVIYYRDQSKSSREYVTKYCFDVHPIRRSEGLAVQYNQCIHWNCMDDDCIVDRCIYEARKTNDDYQKAQAKCADSSTSP